MYYLIMKTAVKPDLKPQTFCYNKSYTLLRETDINVIDFKFYQKLFIIILSLSTILIYPESPKEVENICANYNSRISCIVW